MPAVLAATLADRESNEWVGPGLLGFVIIVGLCVGTYLLWRNMNKQLRKVRFDDGSGDSPSGSAGDGMPTAEAKQQPENGDQPAGSPKQG